MSRKPTGSHERQLEKLLESLATAARHCQEVERAFGANPAPDLETLIQLHRFLIFQYSLEAPSNPEVLKEVRNLMKPVMDWAALQEKRKQRELAEQKYRDQAKSAQNEGNALRPETLEQIEQELSLL